MSLAKAQSREKEKKRRKSLTPSRKDAKKKKQDF
jgi:hypothetical protein